MDMYCGYYRSPIGMLEIKATEKGVLSVVFVEEEHGEPRENEHVRLCTAQLAEYFGGQRKAFTVSLDPSGTEFQHKVWREVRAIPYGSTDTYSGVASKLGNDRASRAVGAANGKNKVGIIVPCHRVIGKNHDLTGYAWGTWRKEWLLKHEQQTVSSAK